MDNPNKKIEINLASIDWKKLSIDDFISLEADLQQKQKLIKSLQPKGKRNQGFVLIKLKGNIYSVKAIIVARLKAMKSEKTKNDLIEEIIATHNAIEQM